MNILFEWITFMFPKAGVQIGSVPLTLSILLLVIGLCLNFKHFLQLKEIPLFIPLYTTVICLSVVTILINKTMDTVSLWEIMQILVAIISPLSILCIVNIDPTKANKIVTISAVFVSLYAIIQKNFGIIKTAIPGITYTFGQSLETKPIGYGHSKTSEAIKMISTYQNGNNYALFLAIAIPFFIAFPTTKNRVLRALIILIMSVGILLSGSRSVIYPFLLSIIFIMLYLLFKLKGRRKIIFILSSTFLILIFLLYIMNANNTFLNELYSRLVATTIQDPTATGRTNQFMQIFEYINSLNLQGLVRFLIIGNPINSLYSEGYLIFIFQMGVICSLCFIGLLLSCVLKLFKHPETRIVSYGLCTVIIAYFIDQSFYFPPSIMIYFMLTWICIKNINVKEENNL